MGERRRRQSAPAGSNALQPNGGLIRTICPLTQTICPLTGIQQREAGYLITENDIQSILTVKLPFTSLEEEKDHVEQHRLKADDVFLRTVLRTVLSWFGGRPNTRSRSERSLNSR